MTTSLYLVARQAKENEGPLPPEPIRVGRVLLHPTAFADRPAYDPFVDGGGTLAAHILSLRSRDDGLAMLASAAKTLAREWDFTVVLVNEHEHESRPLQRRRASLCEVLPLLALNPHTEWLITPARRHYRVWLRCRAFTAQGRQDVVLDVIASDRREATALVAEHCSVRGLAVLAIEGWSVKDALLDHDAGVLPDG